nr:MAG TPA: hypothetical protein [Caudoviricetes sp.]
MNLIRYFILILAADCRATIIWFRFPAIHPV